MVDCSTVNMMVEMLPVSPYIPEYGCYTFSMVQVPDSTTPV